MLSFLDPSKAQAISSVCLQRTGICLLTSSRKSRRLPLPLLRKWAFAFAFSFSTTGLFKLTRQLVCIYRDLVILSRAFDIGTDAYKTASAQASYLSSEMGTTSLTVEPTEPQVSVHHSHSGRYQLCLPLMAGHAPGRVEASHSVVFSCCFLTRIHSLPTVGSLT